MHHITKSNKENFILNLSNQDFRELERTNRKIKKSPKMVNPLIIITDAEGVTPPIVDDRK